MEKRLSSKSYGALIPSNNISTQQIGKKRKPESRLWTRIHPSGISEILECGRQEIMRLTSVSARDLRILGPSFTSCFSILVREKAMVINLDFVKAILTAEEVYVLDPTDYFVSPFVERLKRELPLPIPLPGRNWYESDTIKEPPFEFRVLELVLETICSSLDLKVKELEGVVYPAMDALAKGIKFDDLQYLFHVKRRLKVIAANVQKLKDELAHLLDNEENMANMCFTNKPKCYANASPSHELEGNSLVAQLSNLSSDYSTNVVVKAYVEELEMLLEAYLVQIEGIRNKLITLREYIEDTEDYIKNHLDNQRNQIHEVQIIILMIGFAVSLVTGASGAFAMNIAPPYGLTNKDFVPFLIGMVATSIIIFLTIYGYIVWGKQLL